MTATKCPTPRKPKLQTEDDAVAKAINKSTIYGKAYGYYLCLCGFYHLTTAKKRTESHGI